MQTGGLGRSSRRRITAIPPELHRKLAAAELFHELLEHRWFFSEQAGKDVGMKAATQSCVDDVLRAAPEEKAALLAEDYTPQVPEEDGEEAVEDTLEP